MQSKLLYFLGWALFLVVIFIGSTSPYTAPPTQYHLDKLIHFMAYSVIAIPPAYAIKGISKKVIIAIFLILFGAFIEITQNSIPGRQGSIDDLIANGLGVLTGIIIASNIRKYVNKKT